METNQSEAPAHIVLSSEMPGRFSVAGVKQAPTEIHIHLDGLTNPALFQDARSESKGFTETAGLRQRLKIENHGIVSRLLRFCCGNA